MASIPVTLRVYATSSKFPMCDTPQALDIGLDGNSGEMVIYRISGKHRTLIDSGSVLSMWSSWLPMIWGIRSLNKKPVLDGDWDENWSCVNDLRKIGGDAMIHLTTPNCGPPITISPVELEAALLGMGGPVIQKIHSEMQFPEHSLSEEVTRVIRHNHRIHQIAQEVEEIEL